MLELGMPKKSSHAACADRDLGSLSFILAAAAAAGTTSSVFAHSLQVKDEIFARVLDTSTTSSFLFTQAHRPALYLPPFYTNTCMVRWVMSRSLLSCEGDVLLCKG